MPASTIDPVNAALRTSLTKTATENNLDTQIAGSTKKALLANVEFEAAGSYQSAVLDKLKSKYIVLKQNDTPQASKPETNGVEETLSKPKHELFALESVQLGWTRTDWAVGAGMVNMGNTCYLNSTLQALFHVPALVNWLISDKQHMAECEDSGGLCIICAMRKTLQDSQQRNVNSIRPFLIYNKLRIVCRNLIPGRQEDAHEFLRYLVEAMEKAYLGRFKNHSEFDSRTKETTPLNQILGGYLRSAVRCLECGHVSTTFQHFQDLLLDIRKAQTLDEALELYFSKEKLDDESYHCEACQKKVSATKQFSLERAPMVLCIQLKRFSVSNNKIIKHIQFRQRLELARFARQRPTIPLVYRLAAMVTHMGPTVSCGHYTAVAQAPCGNFYQFDDSMVRPISHQAVFTTNAYIMFYELECSPFAQKPNGTNGTTASKLKPATTNVSSSVDLEKPQNSTKVQINGKTSSKVYGPELPPHLGKTQNGTITSSQNGNKSKNGSPSSSESESEEVTPTSSKDSKTTTTTTSSSLPNRSASLSDAKSKLPTNSKFIKKSVSNSSVTNCSSTSTNTCVISSSTSNAKGPDLSTVSSTSQSLTKLVPYDDESSSSDDVSVEEVDSRISTKAAGGEWKVTSTTDTIDSSSPDSKNNWNKKNSAKEKSSTVTELLKMSHSGYGAPVNSWNGSRAQMEKDIISERREDRKRTLADNADQGRVKHVKLNSNNFKANAGYNPIQEYHNMKNCSQNYAMQPYRPFFNGGNRHRVNNRRAFPHKPYYKGYRHRQ